MKKVAAVAVALVVLPVAAVMAVRTTTGGAAMTYAAPGGMSAAVAVSQRLDRVPADQPETVNVLLPRLGDRAAAERYLRSKGLRVTDLPDANLVTATGSARAVEAAFAVRLFNWVAPSKRTFFANERPARLPFRVDGIFGLDDAFRPQPLLAAGGHCVICPGISAEQLREAYKVDALNNNGLKGDGQTVAIYALSGFDQKYIDDFDASNNLVTPTIRVTRVVRGSSPGVVESPGPGMTPDGGADEFEAELDIEAVHAIADHAAIHVYEMDPGVTYADFFIAVAYNHEHIASISVGQCEADLHRGGSSTDQATASAALVARLVNDEHISALAASGDSGRVCPSKTASKANGGTRDVIGVFYPASDPSVTAVGGTHINSRRPLSEDAWDLPDTPWAATGTAVASGGGPAVTQPTVQPALPIDATSFPRPSWQTAAGMPAGTQRLVPDVAADADPASGLTIAVNPATNSGSNEWVAAGGTSFSAPIWAGVIALADQKAGRPVGLLNPMLYSGAARSSALFDVTTTQNGGPDLAGPAGPGWDFATGLGSPDAVRLVPLLGTPVAASTSDLHAVDWARIRLPAGTCGASSPVQLRGGRATVNPLSGYRGFGTVVVGLVSEGGRDGGFPTYGDLTGDGQDEAALDVTCETTGATAGDVLGSTLYVYGSGEGQEPVLLGGLPSTQKDQFSGSEATGTFSDVKITLGQVAADEHYYLSNDILADPTGLRHHTWLWTADGGFAGS